MTYTELIATAAMLREGNEDVLTVTSFPNEQLVQLYLDTAKREMRLDLEMALSLSPGDTTTLDPIVNTHQVRLQQALAYKQLSIYYQKLDAGENSKSRRRYEFYTNEYKRVRIDFASLKPSDGKITSVKTVTIWR